MARQATFELVVSREIVDEYVEVLQRLDIYGSFIAKSRHPLENRETVTYINLGPRVVASRDRTTTCSFDGTLRQGRIPDYE
jgi:hypothetical protein